jgi:hypothetical protein
MDNAGLEQDIVVDGHQPEVARVWNPPWRRP